LYINSKILIIIYCEIKKILIFLCARMYGLRRKKNKQEIIEFLEK